MQDELLIPFVILRVMTKLSLHIFILFTASLLCFLWISDENLAPYSLQIVALFFIIQFSSKRFLKPQSFKLVESVVATITILLVVGTTGALSSPLFFLNYFLLFALSLLLEPVLPIFLSLILIIFYLLLKSPGDEPYLLLELLAFPFLTPLSYYFGDLYQKVINQRNQLRNMSEKVEELKDELVEEELKLTNQQIN